MAKWKTQKQYLKSSYACPKCGSEDIDAEDVEYVCNAETVQNVSCKDCSAEWRDIYKLVGYEKRKVETYD